MAMRPQTELRNIFREIIMPTLKTAMSALGALMLAAAAPAALAQATINSIKADRTEAQLEGGRAIVKFTVEGDSPENTNCGLIIEYSGIDPSDNRKINNRDGLFPKVVEHAFTRAGTYDVKAKGGKVGPIFGCSGQATVKIVINDPPKAAAAATPAAKGTGARMPAACHEGWTIAQTKADKKSGSYTCKPKKGVLKAPEKRVECPDGLVYFEKGATFGCSK